jgi:hypothetical protein
VPDSSEWSVHFELDTGSGRGAQYIAPPYKRNPGGIEAVDLITRYFLRRLAIARRKMPQSSASASYTDALFDVILVVLGLPGVALLSFIGISTIRWWKPAMSSKWPWLSFPVGALGIWALAIIVGHVWLGRRFGKFRNDPTPCLEFASDKDRQIAFWVKFSVVTVCGLVIPWIAIAIDQAVR